MKKLITHPLISIFQAQIQIQHSCNILVYTNLYLLRHQGHNSEINVSLNYKHKIRWTGSDAMLILLKKYGLVSSA